MKTMACAKRTAHIIIIIYYVHVFYLLPIPITKVSKNGLFVIFLIYV